MESLSVAQRGIVSHPLDRGHLLVLAAPGSGKTRTITERVGSMLTTQKVMPEQVLVMTFSIKAAAELKDRLSERLDTHVEDVWAGTFHAICDRLLFEHGSAIGWGPPFSIYDMPRQQDALRRAADRVGWCFESERDLRKLQERISARKRRGLRADEQPFDGAPDPDSVLAIDEIYRRMLENARALDYDDLILKGIQLMREDHDTARKVRERFTYVFVDEYHDVSPEQYTLLSEIAPARSRVHSLMVVADPNQSIYGWRQANAPRMINQFRRDYRPTAFELEENYRSVGQIVRAAQSVILAGGATASAVAVLADQQPIDCKDCGNAEEEAEWIARQITRACASGNFTYDDIAVLYRTHRRADLLEAMLLNRNIPIVRVQENRFFDDPDVQGALRYLALVAALHDESFEPALNWPRVLVDELTMVQLRRLGDEVGLKLSELAQCIDTFSEQISPLTRTLVRDFVETIGEDLFQVANGPIGVIVDRLLSLLARRRTPIPVIEREGLRGFLGFLAGPLVSPVALLRAALATDRPIVLRHDGSVDGIAGAVILEHTLNHYFQRRALVLTSAYPAPPQAFTITLGSFVPTTSNGFGLGIRDARTIRYSVSTQAWRVGQMLLMSFETLRDGRFIVYDFETSGRQRNTTEILEIAAVPVEGRKIVEPPFHSMVRPKGIISQDAQRVHGILWNDVKNAPIPSAVLPRFLRYIAGDTLVGHNIAEFDHRILQRVAGAEGLPRPENPLVDTCDLAQRLLPGEPHTLAALAQRFGIRKAQTHRALDDARMNGEVFQHLLDLHDEEKELDILNEALPLVAIGVFAANLELEGENKVLALAGARSAAVQMRAHLRVRLAEFVGNSSVLMAAEHSLASMPTRIPDDDKRWDELVDRWRQMIDHYERSQADQSLAAFLHYAALAAPIDHPPEDKGRVTMMTIHNAKGMEWPLVFIVGGEDGTLPLWFAEKDGTLDEERRVLYVGMTRAMRRLCISWVRQDGNWQRGPCRFLQDVPDDLIRWYG